MRGNKHYAEQNIMYSDNVLLHDLIGCYPKKSVLTPRTPKKTEQWVFIKYILIIWKENMLSQIYTAYDNFKNNMKGHFELNINSIYAEIWTWCGHFNGARACDWSSMRTRPLAWYVRSRP